MLSTDSLTANSPFDPDTLTLGELVVFEGITGWPTGDILAAFDGTGVESPKFLLALQTVVGGRGDDSYGVEDASDVPLIDLLGQVAGGE